LHSTNFVLGLGKNLADPGFVILGIGKFKLQVGFPVERNRSSSQLEEESGAGAGAPRQLWSSQVAPLCTWNPGWRWRGIQG